MSHSTEKNPNPSPNHSEIKTPPRSKRPRALSLPDIWLKEQDLKYAFIKMHLKSVSSTPSHSPLTSSSHPNLQFLQSLSIDPPGPDYFSHLSDELLLQIFSKLPISQHVSNSLVCKRWLYLHGRLVQSLNLTDWSFIESGRVFLRFPNLSDINIISACIRTSKNSGILVTHKSLSVHVDARLSPTNGFVVQNDDLVPSNSIDQVLELLAKNYPNLRRIVVVGAREKGLSSIANECHTLQELEFHCCGDLSLKGISACQNLQVVKLIGSINGFYSSVVSDIGLTILAQGCRRLVKLELSGCEGSYDGIKAIGQCCQMLEELTLCDHRMDGGWLAALTFCGNLKTLRLQSCKNVDSSPGSPQHLGSCLTLEELQLQGCQLRDKQSVEALFLVCENVREIVLQNCWGLEDDVFGLACICRRVKILSLEGCSLLTTGGLESVVLSWKELQRLRVVSCNKIKDGEITPALASLFSVFKELKWRPDSRFLLSSGLAGTGVGKKGVRFFKGLKP
ncbi:F-box protein At5g51370-like isoform X2 [Pistacia vera]|uniref:F-box protein At5g51370-like isoform X2 n=1 Tax=Pistacia vera TaxID=55513 RepID=UPI00126342BE|nr:F-box protein At5g51370-like isoform X2 [Pistacia vera]